MSTPPKPPERLAEILLEILALSDSPPTSQSKPAGSTDPLENFDSHRVEEQSQQAKNEDSP